MDTSTERVRLHLLDTLRGLALIHMVLYHLLFDLAYIFDVALPRSLEAFMPTHYVSMASFVFLAGITARLSRNSAKHGARLMLIAVCFTLVTSYAVPGAGIYFGVLHLISAGMLLYGAAADIFNRLPWWLGLCLSLLLFSLTIHTMDGYLGWSKELSFTIPYQFNYQSFLYPFGFIDYNFSSIDYVPILPWIFVFLCGVFTGSAFSGKKLPDFVQRDFCPPVTWLGKNSLVIYIVHQPVFLGVLYIIFKFMLKEF